MSDLRDLYQEVILDHNRRPHNFRHIDEADRVCEGFNPLCGDRLTLFLDLEGDVIKDVAFEGTGCAISRASASLMTDAVKGKSVSEARALFERFHQLVTSAPDRPADTAGLGKLAVFAGVREYPTRIKCATLSWYTMRAALGGNEKKVSTE
jgi:nitrogen fixation NifU-like protein